MAPQKKFYLYGTALVAIPAIAFIMLLVENYIPLWLLKLTIPGMILAALILGTALVIENLRISRQERLARERLEHETKRG